MIRFLAMILMLAMAQITPVTSDVIAGGETIVQIEATIPEEVHGLILHINYNSEHLTAINITRGNLSVPDSAMCCMDCSIPGRCSIGIICPTEGILGAGVLANIYFRVSPKCDIDQEISVTVSECYSMPLGGEQSLVPCEGFSAAIHVIRPTASAAIQVMRYIIGLSEAPTWGDVNNDGAIHTDDALLILRWALEK